MISIDEIRPAICANLSDPDFNLQKASRILFVSTRSLQRSLQKEGSPGFRHELWKERMRRAETLLLEGHPSSGVALEVGYRRSEHFARAFARWSGKTPTRWLSAEKLSHQPLRQKARQHGQFAHQKLS